MSVPRHGLVVSRTDGSNHLRLTPSGHIGRKRRGGRAGGRKGGRTGGGVVSGERERGMEMDGAAVCSLPRHSKPGGLNGGEGNGGLGV